MLINYVDLELFAVVTSMTRNEYALQELLADIIRLTMNEYDDSELLVAVTSLTMSWFVWVAIRIIPCYCQIDTELSMLIRAVIISLIVNENVDYKFFCWY